jgi:hypothetical protein
MGAKRVRWWVALLLPGLVLRSLIPLGFMPMFGPGYDVRFVVCESYAPVPGATSSSMDMPMDMPMDAATSTPDHLRQNAAPHVDHGVPAHQDHNTCPYGSGPTLGGLPALAIVLVAVRPVTEPAVTAAQVAYFEVSPRAQSPRGPPA